MAYLNRYDIGDQVRSQITFSVNGTATDPTNITVKVKTPTGATSTYVYGTHAQVVRVTQGQYRIDIATTENGIYHVKWIGTGTAEAVEEDAFFVNVPAIA